MLLGKILRIDVDHPDLATGALYSSPPDNPFVGRDGRDEIFALGLRNPWRFSFDRATGQQWVGDVGEDLLEEVDTPIVKGANYGWRVYEGSQCFGLDPALCGPTGSMPSQFTPPRFEYPHDAGRCAVTGGYVYRGAANVLAGGTYVYGDFCTGEVFAWDGTTQNVLIGVPGWISSFGEDQQGELYITDIEGGHLYRLDPGPSSCTFSVSPSALSVGAGGGSFNTSVTTTAGCGWTAVANASWLYVTSGSSGTGSGTVGYSVDASSTLTPRTGTLTVAGAIFTVDQDAVPCTYSLTPTGQNVVAAGGTGTTAVGAQTGCTWTAVANASWLHVTSGSSGSGNGTVGYSVDTNGTVSSRTGTLTIAGLTFTVDQAAAACTYNISPTSASFGKGGGGGTVTVTATSGCSWTAVSNNPTWITIKSGANGIGNGTVGYAILKNTGRSRSGTIQIAEKTFTVSQK